MRDPSLPDDWSWRAFDQHFGDDEQPVEEKCRHGIPLDETCEDCADVEQWYNMDK